MMTFSLIDWARRFCIACHWGTAASVAASYVSSQMQADSAESAAGAQQQGTGAAIQEQQRQYNLTRKDLAPYRKTGAAANNRLAMLLGLPSSVDPDAIRERLLPSYTALGVSQGYGVADEANLSAAVQSEVARLEAEAAASPEFGSLNKKFTLADFWDDPVTQASYQFGLDTGTKALGNMAGARGNRNSGAQLKALTKFGTDYTGGQAASSSGRFYGDQDRTFNRLSSVSGAGQAATTNGAMFGQNSANTISGLLSNQGNQMGQAAIAQGNIRGSAAQNIGNTIGNWWNTNNGGYTGPTGGSDGWGGYGGDYYGGGFDMGSFFT